MHTRVPARAWFAWLALALPLLAIKLWVLLGVGYYRPDQFGGDAVAVLAWCALLVLAARWRLLGAVTWIVGCAVPAGVGADARGGLVVLLSGEFLQRPVLRQPALGQPAVGIARVPGAVRRHDPSAGGDECGAPYLPSPVRALDLGGNNANTGSFQPTLACLGDILHAAGYDQTFMNGSRLSFADQGAFFHLHGFDHVLGLDELEKQNGDKLASPGWGLYDSDLFRLAVRKFDALAASGKPFNFDVLTIDDHPQRGRPSPGCPKYAANDNSMLQAVHCTDNLVGKFLDTIARNPAFKNTIVVVMSNHQSLPNDAWPLYPKWYKRRPLLFILNGGQGRRDMRFYHMDIAPTVLHLMGVKTNARFIAGADRSEPNAPGSPLVNDATDAAVLRQVLWARARPIVLCKEGELIGPAAGGFEIGGLRVPLTWKGRHEVALYTGQSWLASVVPAMYTAPSWIRPPSPPSSRGSRMMSPRC